MPYLKWVIWISMPFLIFLLFAAFTLIIWCIFCISIAKIKKRKAVISDIDSTVRIKQEFKLKYFLIVEFVIAVVIVLFVLLNYKTRSYEYFDLFETDDFSVSYKIEYESKLLSSSELAYAVKLHIEGGEPRADLNLYCYPDELVFIDENDINCIEENAGVIIVIKFSEYCIKTYKFNFDMFDEEGDCDS